MLPAVQKYSLETGKYAYRGRSPLGSLAHIYKGAFGRCVWCAGEARKSNGRPLRWHPLCHVYYQAASGLTRLPSHRPLIPLGPCVDCGEEQPTGEYAHPKHQLDHRVAIAVAARTGPREWARALMPGNLQWLCPACHKRKTVRDIQAMRKLEGREDALPDGFDVTLPGLEGI